MDVDIYKTVAPPAPRERLFLLVPSGADMKKLPDDIIAKTGRLFLFKTISLVPGKLRIALDQDEAMKNLEKQGYHLQAAKIEVGQARSSGNVAEKTAGRRECGTNRIDGKL